MQKSFNVRKTWIHNRPIIGVLTGWNIYTGWSNSSRTLHPYWSTFLQGIHTAARELECNILLACGMTHSFSQDWYTVGPMVSEMTNFLPIGSWNTDGLIVVPPLRSTDAVPTDVKPSTIHEHIQKARANGHPIVFAGAGEPGPSVMTDNYLGVKQAIAHLIEHGHKRIAFIAGKDDQYGDAPDRLHAYQTTMQDYGLEIDPRLIVPGKFYKDEGRQAMQHILQSGLDFTAVLAANDESAYGAIDALRDAGRRIPEDVAIIGFDDLIDSTVQQPRLTSIYNPVMEIGYQALALILKYISGDHPAQETIVVPTRLIVRESCGCQSSEMEITLERKSANLSSNPLEGTGQTALVQKMFQVLSPHIRRVPQIHLTETCQHLVQSLFEGLHNNDIVPFRCAMHAALGLLDTYEEVTHTLQLAFSVVRNARNDLAVAYPEISCSMIDEMVDLARILISDHIQRKYQQTLIQQRELIHRLDNITAQLHSTLDERLILDIVAREFPRLGLGQTFVTFYEGEGDDSVAWSTLHAIDRELRFPSRSFPPPDLYPAEKPFHLALLPLNLKQGGAGFVAFDMTSFELYSIIVWQLASALQNARLYRMKSHFLSVVSHELRTPLNLIVGLSEIVLREQKYSDFTGAPQYIKDIMSIHNHAQHLGHLINDVLDLTQGENQQLKLFSETLQILDILPTIVETGQQLAQAKGLYWHYTAPKRLSKIWGDRTRLQQVILNLVSNAVKFTSQGNVELRIFEQNKHIIIEVSDTGIGVSPDEQSAIFGAFHQAERTQVAYRGVGLGLAISKHIIQLHGGSISVRSSGIEGQGSTFSFTLPILHDQKQEKTILLVDDNVDTLEMHARIIQGQSNSYHLLRAHNGREAMALLRHTRPDLVVLDLMMPEMNGFAVLEEMQRNEQTCTIPVVILTAKVLTEADFQRLSQSMVTVLNKGVLSVEETLRQIENSLERKPVVNTKNRQLVRAAIAYIHAHYQEDIAREMISQHLGISKAHLNRCFQQEMGIAPMTYLSRYRVQRAKILLARGEMSIGEIAAATGFSDLSHLGRVFLREAGMTPSAYRQAGRRL